MKIGQMINFIDASAFPVSPFKKVLRGDTGRRSRQTMLNLGGSDRREHNPREVMPAEPGAGLVEVEYRQQNIRPLRGRYWRLCVSPQVRLRLTLRLSII